MTYNKYLWAADDIMLDEVEVDDAVEADADSGMSERMMKSADEHRFTLAPWYIPGKYDSEDEWTDAAELQTSLWGYVRNGDRGIRLQHNKDVKAGEWVEALTLPFAWTVPMYNSKGQTRNITYPAGTVLLGVIWEEWAWDEVKQGKITGFSIGGSAQRIDESIRDMSEGFAADPIAKQVQDTPDVMTMLSAMITEAVSKVTPNVTVVMPEQKPRSVRIERDANNVITRTVEE